jgi:hypothetical protein
MVSAALEQCLAHYASSTVPAKDLERAAVKEVLAKVSAKAPGKSVELRIPPYAAVQVVAGPNHRRGTPSAVVEMNAATLLLMAAGKLTWDEAVRNGTVIASGERSNLSNLFPC